MDALAERLRSWAQNEEMIDQHYLPHGRDCNAAADAIDSLLAALDALRAAAAAYEDDPDLDAAKTAADTAIAQARGK